MNRLRTVVVLFLSLAAFAVSASAQEESRTVTAEGVSVVQNGAGTSPGTLRSSTRSSVPWSRPSAS